MKSNETTGNILTKVGYIKERSIFKYLKINPGPAEPGYALSLQTV